MCLWNNPSVFKRRILKLFSVGAGLNGTLVEVAGGKEAG